MINRNASYALLAVLACASICSAQIIFYPNRAAWQAAVRDATTIDFTKAAPPPAGNYTTYPTPPGLTLSGVTSQIPNPESLCTS